MQKISIVVDVQRKIVKTFKEKKISSGSEPKLTLTPTLSLRLGLKLGLTPGRKVRVQNLKPNAKG